MLQKVLIAFLFFSMVWGAVLIYNFFYTYDLNTNDLPVDARLSVLIAKKRVNGLNPNNGPYDILTKSFREATIDNGTYFTVTLAHSGNICRKKYVNIEKNSGKVLAKKTDNHSCN